MSRPVQTVVALCLAVGSTFGLYLWQGHEGFSLWDEGFLWYGAQRVVQGEIPIRDFMAYDPGRYYWSALFMGLRGEDGIISLRLAATIFQAVGLFIGLRTLAGSSRSPSFGYMLLAATTLVVWMFPREKFFDVSLALGLIGLLAFLVERPSNRRAFLAGLGLGIVAIFGRNHGVYGLVGSLGTLFYLQLGAEARPRVLHPLGSWAVGVVVGYAPLLLMLALTPGLAAAFGASIADLFVRGATNLPLPVPWPWLVRFEATGLVTGIHDLLTGLTFMVIAAFAIASLVWVVRRRLRGEPASPALVASAFLALPYAHFAFSRPDVVHLAQGVFPFLIGSLALLADQPRIRKWPLAGILCVTSLAVMLPVQPGAQCHISLPCTVTHVAGDRLRINRVTANHLAMIEKLANDHAPDGRSFLVAPFWPGAYAAFGRRSPMWENYALFPRSDEFQRREIERIEAADPGFALIVDVARDGVEASRFSNSHPLIDRYLRENFDRLEGYKHTPHYQIFVARESAD
jgi:hypothetical protein